MNKNEGKQKIKTNQNKQIHLRSSQALLHCCSKCHWSKPTSTLRCDFVSNQSSQPLQQVMIFLQILFLFQTKLPNTRMCSLSLSKPLSYSKLKFETHAISKPLSCSKLKISTHMKEKKKQGEREKEGQREKQEKKRGGAKKKKKKWQGIRK